LQKVLLNIVKAISTPDQLIKACIERWKSNLELLYQNSQKQLKELVKSKEPYRYIENSRMRFLCERLVEGSRFLYVGCGKGTECLSLANNGLNVVGIDTNFLLTRTANAWSSYLAQPFQPICMDLMELGFKQETFDSFLIEFYGHLPLLDQNFLVQRNLARLLRKGAQGFVVGLRKNYPSFWYLMKSISNPSMVKWLVNQSQLDFRWDNPDGHEEKLMYGLYHRTHTVDSLSKELGYAFRVIKCLYERHDPRYVICIVEPKENLDSQPEVKGTGHWERNVSHPESRVGSISEILDQDRDYLQFH
jgi:2-polyprenyl-3-methyl-5-hydroxy-6-metoxy-1,4-benzoquinol methylase